MNNPAASSTIAIISVSAGGMALALRINQILNGQGELWIHASSTEDPGKTKGTVHVFSHLKDVIDEIWEERRVLIFVMATGIVVREIAHLLKRKDKDPAVLVLDEAGKYVIPLLSGHLGGANVWARQLASGLGAEPIITTATDGRGLIAPDEWARKLGWKVLHLEHLPALNGKMLRNGSLSEWSEHTLTPQHPLRQASDYRFLSDGSEGGADFIISAFPKKYLTKVCLVPPLLSIGVGCRKGVSKEQIIAGISEVLEIIQSVPEAIGNLASIDLKAYEPGLVDAAAMMGLPLKVFSAGEIDTVNLEENLAASEFVQEKIGVKGVCEAASILGSNRGSLILAKIKRPGMTLAVSQARFLS